MKRLFASAILASAVAIAAPASAQDDAGDKVNMVIIYGDDDCPETTDDIINVCAVHPEEDRYRIPGNLRTSESGENVAWAERVKSFKSVGAFGTLSCSPAGSGGVTGCTQKMIDAAYGEKGENKNIRFGQLIEAERAERLSKIDEEAADTQARVEVIEREYLERLEKERAAPVPGVEGAAVDTEPLPNPQAATAPAADKPVEKETAQ